MSEANKQAARRFLEALGGGDAATVDALITDDCEAVCTGSAIVSRTRVRGEIVGSCKYFQRIMKQGIDFEILTMTAEDDRVSVEAIGKSELSTGVRYDNQYHFLFFFRDGKIRLLREYLDTKLADDVFRPFLTGAES